MNVRVELLIAEIVQKTKSGELDKRSPNLERDVRACVLNNAIMADESSQEESK
jgi:hypothetical protein